MTLEELLPHVNASLNGLATVLLVVGYALIKQKRVEAHKRTMLACFAVSTGFLVCYLIYHALHGNQSFTGQGSIRYFYYTILLSHIVLAATVPILAIGTIVLGLQGKFGAHRRLARWTFPIWLYVSVTGVVVYVMLYQIYA